MPDATTSKTQEAERIAKAVGMLPNYKPTDDPDAILILTEINDDAKKLAQKAGTMMYVPGSDASPIKQINVILDGTGSAENILPFVVRISVQELADIRLLVPSKGAYITGTPMDRYVTVLVNTMKEQHLQISGKVVDGSLFEDAARSARENHGMVALSVTGSNGLKNEVFGAGARKHLKGVPVLLYSPV